MHKWWCDQHPEQNLCKMWNWHVKLRETEGKIMDTEERPKFGPPVHSVNFVLRSKWKTSRCVGLVAIISVVSLYSWFPNEFLCLWQEHLNMKEEYCKAHDPASELCKHVAKGNAKRQTKKQPKRKSLLGSLFGVELWWQCISREVYIVISALVYASNNRVSMKNIYFSKLIKPRAEAATSHLLSSRGVGREH